jgi:hypothetical protein
MSGRYQGDVNRVIEDEARRGGGICVCPKVEVNSTPAAVPILSSQPGQARFISDSGIRF